LENWFLLKNRCCATASRYAYGSRLESLDTVAQTGHFARSPKQVRAHFNLPLRTLAPPAHYSRDLPADSGRQMLPVIHERHEKWDIQLPVFADVDWCRGRQATAAICRLRSDRLILRQGNWIVLCR
jgi:hypothetical protein